MGESFTSTSSLWGYKIWKNAMETKSPRSFWLEVTARCNNNCRQCYNNIAAENSLPLRKEITLEEIKRVVDEAASLGCLNCILTGGEPLFREDFFEIYRYLKKKGMLVNIFTNGTLITEEHVDLFKRYPPWGLEVTVYGVTRETYERVTRRKGSFDSFMRGLNLLFDNGIAVELKIVAMRSNYHELIDMARFCKERTDRPIFFDPFIHLRIDGNGLRNDEVNSERLSPKEILALEGYDPTLLRIREKACNIDTPIEGNQKRDNCVLWCNAGGWSFLVDHTCQFHPCASLWHPDFIYDLRRGNLSDAWNIFSPKVKDKRSSKDSKDACSQCPLLYLCYSCPAHAYLEKGDLESKVDYFCQIAHERARAHAKI